MKYATLGRARVIKQGCKYFVALIAKTKVSIFLEKNSQESTSLTIRRYPKIKFINNIENGCGQYVPDYYREIPARIVLQYSY